MTEVAQPVPGQDPAAPAVTGPWANAVTQTFTDPVIAAQVDQFMKSHYQPYVTRLENERTAAKQATDFYNSFQEDADAGAAFLSLAEEMFGAEAVDSIVAALGGDEPAAPPNDPQEDPVVAQLTPEQQQLLEWAAAQKAEQEQAALQQTYEQQKAEFLAKDEYKDVIDPTLFDPFLAANNGDWEKAAGAYKAFHEKFAPTPEPTPAPAPATLPGSAPTPATTEDFGGSFDAAWESFAAEQRALKPAPPTV